MQFPTIPSQRVTPVVRTDVAEVNPVKPLSGTQTQPVVSPPAGPAVTGQPAPVPPPVVERRQGSRRDTPDRRRQQVPVLLDTRSGRDRRGSRRRADDPPPGRLNERA